MSQYFQKGTITAFPTDTSFGLGVRADDPDTLERLKTLKQRPEEKYFSLMVKDLKMLKIFAQVQDSYTKKLLQSTPLTALLKPSDNLPKSLFWPEDKVAFRIATIPEVADAITYPITATSANLSGQDPIFDIEKIKENFGDNVVIFPGFEELPHVPPSEIWDFTVDPPRRLR